jgi:hypothetical protein
MTSVIRQRRGRIGVCVLLATIVAWAIALGAPSAGLGFTQACLTGQLRHLVATAPIQNVNGRRTLSRMFLNTGEACALDGFPRVEFVGRGGVRLTGLEARVHNERGVQPQRIIVPRRGYGYFKLSFKEGPLCGGRTFTITGFEVNPPSHLTDRRPPEPVCDFSAEVSPYRSTP